MKQPKRKRTRLPSGLAGSYDAADGLDPRFDPSPAFEAGLDGSADRRKLRQLCSQVLKTLQMAWPSHEDVLTGTDPRDVLPAPNSHNLLVLVYCNQSASQVPDEVILATLASHTGFLRQEIAAAIHRKRTPRLAFAMVPREPTEPS